jgi:transcriptional regulator with XRE-family HTH domain
MLGNELRKAREDADLTQEQLSYAAQIDRTYISQLENNRKSPTVDVLFRLCDALGVSASGLLARVETTRKPKAKKK